MRRAFPVMLGCLLLSIGSSAQPPARVEWVLDNLTRIGGHDVLLIGAPRVVDTPLGKAVEFNGATDGLLIEVNPLRGMTQFTVEALFEPAKSGS